MSDDMLLEYARIYRLVEERIRAEQRGECYEEEGAEYTIPGVIIRAVLPDGVG